MEFAAVGDIASVEFAMVDSLIFTIFVVVSVLSGICCSVLSDVGLLFTFKLLFTLLLFDVLCSIFSSSSESSS